MFSGYLHIGHLKAALINYVIAKTFNGEFIMRFDDTNPAKESDEFVNAISEDIKKMGIVPSKITCSSDYFPFLVECADALIDTGNAYVDDSDKETIKQGRFKQIDSTNRSNSISMNKELWNNMKNGKASGCVRLKIDMKHTNAACRDPTIFRFVDKNHHRTKDQFKVYPTYDFACPIIDSIEGVTHVFRSTEFADRDEQYEYMLNSIINLNNSLLKSRPLLFSYGKVQFDGSVMSKRKIKQLIEDKIISGWDDPRLFTIRGLLNKGVQVNALQQYIAKLGFSKNGNNTKRTDDNLSAINKKIIDKIATRYFALPEICKGNVYIIDNYHDNVDVDYKEVPRFVRNIELGNRIMYYNECILIEQLDYSIGEEITLMNWKNVVFQQEEHNKSFRLAINPTGDFKTTEKKVVWIANKNTVTLLVKKYGGLNDPIIETIFIGEEALINVNIGECIQIMKLGYYMCTYKNVESRMLHLVEIN